jgi:hypothetical protein
MYLLQFENGTIQAGETVNKTAIYPTCLPSDRNTGCYDVKFDITLSRVGDQLLWLVRALTMAFEAFQFYKLRRNWAA